jgi:hypothetical protein
MSKIKKMIQLTVFSAAILFNMPTFAADEGSPISSCLKSWGTHPFGADPKFKTLTTSVKVFGIGKDTIDSDVTDAPALIMVSPGVNVMGGSTISLLNPNGWYCFRSNVNVMGGLTIKAHCNAKLASSTEGATVMGSNPDQSKEQKGVTVLGSSTIERVGCK